MSVYLAPDDRVIRVVGDPGFHEGEMIEIVLPEEPLKRAMTHYALNIVWPVGADLAADRSARLTSRSEHAAGAPDDARSRRNMLHFSENPEDASRIIQPSGPLGLDRHRRARARPRCSASLPQLLDPDKGHARRARPRDGKISHDLRNMLANAQLISDRLAGVPDPTVGHLAPKLIGTLDRAINFCHRVAPKFGRVSESEAAP